MKKRYVIYTISYLLCLILISFLFTGCRTRQETGEKETISEITPWEFKKTLNLTNSSITYYTGKTPIIAPTESVVKESDEPLTIVDYGPVDELPAGIRRPTIYVMFSQPVVPLAQLGEVMKTSDIMIITPAITGIYRWYGSRLLSFEPGEKYLPQREYRVSIRKTLRSLGGKPLQGASEFSFHTDYLDIVDFFPGSPYAGYSLNDVPLEEAKTITISFNYPVSPDVIQDYITVASRGKQYKFTISRPENQEGLNEQYRQRTIVLTMKQDFTENSEVTVTLARGARSEPGYIGRPDDRINTFHTITPFTFKKHASYSYSFPRSEKGDANPVYLEFSHPVDRESASRNIKVSLDVEDIDTHLSVWGRYIKLSNLPITYGGSYRVDINKGIRDMYRRSLDTHYSVQVKVDEAPRYYHFPNYGTRMLEAAFEPNIIFEHQNIFDGVWRIDAISDPYSTFPGSTLQTYDFSYAKKNVAHYRIINLGPWLNEEKKGVVGISWNFQDKNKNGIRPSWGQYNLQVQVTDLGITTRYAYNKMVVMVTSLSTGNPVAGAKVMLETGNSMYLYEYTAKDGTAVFHFQEGEYLSYFSTKNRITQPRIIVQKDLDRAVFIPNFSHDPYHFGIYHTMTINHAEDKRMTAYLFTDRGLYKSGETLTFGGIDRDIKLGKLSVYQGPYTIQVKEDTWDAEPFYTKEGVTNKRGTFSGSFILPGTLEPGHYTITYSREKQREEFHFQVAHFKRLSFSVHLTSPDLTFYNGDTITMTCKASYLSGGFMGNADYEYHWTKKVTHSTPPGEKWKEYRFGPDKYEGAVHISADSGKLSGNGKAEITQETSLETTGATYEYTCETRVTDVDRQMVAGKESVLVHPASFYIGAKIDSGVKGYWSSFVPRGKKMDIACVLVTPGGDDYHPGENQILEARLYHVEWKAAVQKGVSGRMNQRYERVEELEDEKDIGLTTSGVTFQFTPRECGSYVIECESSDTMDRSALTRFYFYSTGSSWIYWGFDNPRDIRLLPDRDIYNPGEKVHLLVQSSIPAGRYLLTIEREGILEEKVIALKGSANVIDIPVESAYLPVFYVTLSSFTGRTADPPDSYFKPDLGKPGGYFGITVIKVSREMKQIDIEITPGKKVYKPGTDALVTIKATYRGKPLSGAEVTFIAADRGVLDLINYHINDPLASFYAPEHFPLGTAGADSRSLLMDPVTYDVKDLPGGGGKGSMEESGNKEMERESIPDIDVRKDFRALAVFQPGLITDPAGTVECRFSLPDSLTTYRMTAVAVKDDLFGKKEDDLMVQNPLNVRTALPRRLRVRDTSFAGVVITNLDTRSHEVKVTAEVTIITINGECEKVVRIPPNASVEVPFTLLAVQSGEATIQFTIASEILNEGLEEKLIVEKPVIKETVTITGKTPAGEEPGETGQADEGIILPSFIAEGYGGLSLILDSTRLASLGEGIQYLFDYPYGCVEQHLSSLIPLILFGDTIRDLGLSSRVIDIQETIENTLGEIARFQNADGGVPFWMEGGYRSSDYCSVKLAHVVFLAKKYGYSTGPLDIKALLHYLSGIRYPDYSRYNELYGLYVLSLFKEHTGNRAEMLYREEKMKSLVSYSFLGLIFFNKNNISYAQDCLVKIKNYMKVGTRSIDIAEPRRGRYYFNSGVQELALLLMLYKNLDMSSDLIGKITFSLMKRQKYGYWMNTSDTSWVLLACAQLLESETGRKTDFTASVLIGNETLCKTLFRGISSQSYTASLAFDDQPLVGIQRDILIPLSFIKQGNGTLFYTANLTYALPAEVVHPRDEGFSLYSEITDLDGKRQEISELDPGQTYRMRVVISSSKKRNFVVLRVPVPSGGEILDASFVTTATYTEEGGIDQGSRTGETAYGDEYEYSNWGYYAPRKKIYDNEVQYFFNDFPLGRQEIEFLFRLTTPGIYPVPPVYAECMYEPEVFGRTAGEIYIIGE